MAAGKEKLPKKVRLTTFTTRYNTQEWVAVDALEKHWERARAEAEITGQNTVRLKTENVAALTLTMDEPPFAPGSKVRVELDGQQVEVPGVTKGGWTAHLAKAGEQWKSGEVSGLHKKHGLQGPVDDAFMGSFLMVRPTGTAISPEAGQWVEQEFARATNAWRGQFRGYARVKQDSEVSEADIREHHLILWGDPQSNRLLQRLSGKLPVEWAGRQFKMRGKTYSTSQHLPVMIFPNPLNPEKYVVLNSGFTFSEFGSASNAQQTPKLPDYAVVDLSVPVAERLARGISEAGFFDERWQ
jgi:hypothetical protein